jgi:hypothetical protein
LLAGAGCTADPAPLPRNNPADVTVAGWPWLAERLTDSWVEDGRVGFFVDAVAGPDAPAFSLHETYWNVLLGEVDPGRTSRLAPDRVATWLGRAALGELPGAGLPSIGQISYATEIADRIGVPLDRAAVERSLATLRTGALFRPAVEATGGDWGSTALAARVLTALGSPVPEETARAAYDRAAKPPASLTVETVATEFVPVLEVLGHAYGPATGSPPGPPPAGLQRLLDRAQATLDTATPAGPVLAARYQLDGAGRLLGLTVAQADQRLCAAGRGGGTAPQLRYYALSLGCAEVPVPDRTPYSRAGWPPLEAPDVVLGSTVTGARVAAALGVLDGFATRLATTLDRIWLPLARAGGTADPAAAAMVGRVLQLTGTLGREAPADLVGLVRGTDPAAMLTVLIGVSLARGEDAARRAAVRSVLASLSPNGGSLVMRAAMLEAASRVLGDPDLHDRALAQVQQLALAPTLFAGEDNGHARTPSLTTSAIGAWISRGTTPPFDDWVSVGLCTPDGQCGEAPGEARPASLRTAALVLACRRPGCGEDFPVSL